MQQLDNAYVKKYYDAHVRSLRETYTDARWHSSVVREFDYRQTLRALQKALAHAHAKTAIEIGPGDGVWTPILRRFVSGRIHLVEQSDEMLAQAQKRLQDIPDITFERADVMESNPPAGVDLIVAIRCFEYFKEKKAALNKMFALLAPGGRLVIVTKNAQFITSASVQGETVHSDQLSRAQMRALLRESGLRVESVYPAIFRWKAGNALMRVLFDAAQRVAVASGGRIQIPLLATYAAESFVYVATRPV